jgi:hypothetical protein
MAELRNGRRAIAAATRSDGFRKRLAKGSVKRRDFRFRADSSARKKAMYSAVRLCWAMLSLENEYSFYILTQEVCQYGPAGREPAPMKTPDCR